MTVLQQMHFVVCCMVYCGILRHFSREITYMHGDDHLPAGTIIIPYNDTLTALVDPWQHNCNTVKTSGISYTLLLTACPDIHLLNLLSNQSQRSYIHILVETYPQIAVHPLTIKFKQEISEGLGLKVYDDDRICNPL